MPMTASQLRADIYGVLDRAIETGEPVAIWVAEGAASKFPARLRARLGAVGPLYSPMLYLELSFLHQVGRLKAPAAEIITKLEGLIDLRPAVSDFEKVARLAATIAWTRDPFDRMIAAHALADGVPLVTKDATMLQHCAVATWDE